VATCEPVRDGERQREGGCDSLLESNVISLAPEYLWLVVHCLPDPPLGREGVPGLSPDTQPSQPPPRRIATRAPPHVRERARLSGQSAYPKHCRHRPRRELVVSTGPDLWRRIIWIEV